MINTIYNDNFLKYKNLYQNVKKHNKKYSEFGFIVSKNKIDNIRLVDFQTGNNNMIQFQLIQFYVIPESSLTYNINSQDKNRILILDNIDDFDLFTNKYGDLYKIKKIIFINWDKVALDYKGFGIDESINKNLFNKRFYQANFKNIKYTSWWQNEWTFDVVIFKKVKNINEALN